MVKVGAGRPIHTDYVFVQGTENPECPPGWPDSLGNWEESDSFEV